MVWVRVDNRLIHGQVVEAWLPYLNAKKLVVVNDELAQDALQQQILSLAVPEKVQTEFIYIDQGLNYFKDYSSDSKISLFLLKDCPDAKRLIEQGTDINSINIGNLHFAKGKEQLSSNISVTPEDINILSYFKEKGIELDFRCIPNDTPEVKKWWQ